MNKIYCFVLSFVLSFVFFNNALAHDKKIESDLYEINLKTQINLNTLLNKYKDKLFIKKIDLSVWTGLISGRLPASDFSSKENMNDVRMKFTARINITAPSAGLLLGIKMAHFNNQKDAVLAFYDSGSFVSSSDKGSLFSGEKMDAVKLCSQNLDNIMACSGIMYKGYAFQIIMRCDDSRGFRYLQKEDFDFADNMVLNIKDLIDKSIK